MAATADLPRSCRPLRVPEHVVFEQLSAPRLPDPLHAGQDRPAHRRIDTSPHQGSGPGGGWLHVRNKPRLGWRIKTGTERKVPLLAEVCLVLRQVLGPRTCGPVFRRRRFARGQTPLLVADLAALTTVCQRRQSAAGGPGQRSQSLRIAATVWQDAGAVKADRVRTSFVRIVQTLGLVHVTCPKSWRHTYATLLQDANVDPLVRQLTLGHRPTSGAGLGMTARYTHTRPET
jgi:integrase